MTAHGRIRLLEERCTACNICARECPTWCITVASHTEPLPDSPPGPRQRTRPVLDAFTLDWSACIFCGICLEECPFDALVWSPDPVPSAAGPEKLVHGRVALTAGHGPAPD